MRWIIMVIAKMVTLPGTPMTISAGMMKTLAKTAVKWPEANAMPRTGIP